MPLPLQPTMAQALRLTRSGRLGEATALLRTMFDQTAGSAIPPAPAAPAISDAIVSRRGRPPVPIIPQGVAAVDAARGGSFEQRSYRGPAGRLDYRLYIPEGATARMPLVVMLHGCTQTPEDFARGTGMNRLADELRFLVAYPAQSRAANAQGCWNWFKPADQQRDSGEPALIAAVTREVVRDESADPARVYVAGLSAGGAAAAIMASAYPDLYAAVGIHSGLACGSARDLPSAMMAMRSGGRAAPAAGERRFVPVITFHGDRDATVNEVNSRTIVADAAAAAGDALGTRSETGQGGGGRRYTRVVSVSADDEKVIEQWTIHGGGHAWSGGDASGSYTDPAGPSASREMLRFFFGHRLSDA